MKNSAGCCGKRVIGVGIVEVETDESEMGSGAWVVGMLVVW